MGVETSSFCAYGVDTYGDPPSGWNAGEWYDGVVDQWLRDHGYTYLQANTGGDQWSGPQRWSIHVTSSHTDPEDGKGVELPHVNEVAKAQMNQLRYELGWDDLPSWKLYKDVY